MTTEKITRENTEEVTTTADLIAALEEKVQSGTASALEKKILAYWQNARQIIGSK